MQARRGAVLTQVATPSIPDHTIGTNLIYAPLDAKTHIESVSAQSTLQIAIHMVLWEGSQLLPGQDGHPSSPSVGS